jgi:hypothetical protein
VLGLILSVQGKSQFTTHVEYTPIKSVIHEKDGLIVWVPSSALISVDQDYLTLTIQESGLLVQLSRALGVLLLDPIRYGNYIITLSDSLKDVLVELWDLPTS